MPFKPRHIDDLAEEVGGVGKAKDLLRQADATVIGSWYDHGALEAMFREPKLSNIGKDKKTQWTIAETDGVGAFKFLLDRVNLDITRHLYRGSNWLTVRNDKNRRRHVKVLTTSRISEKMKRAQFTISGLLAEDAPAYYFLVCFDGPIGWVFKRRDLVKIYQEVQKKGHYEDVPGTFFVPQMMRQNQVGGFGAMHVRPNFDSPWLLVNRAQLDL